MYAKPNIRQSPQELVNLWLEQCTANAKDMDLPYD